MVEWAGGGRAEEDRGLGAAPELTRGLSETRACGRRLQRVPLEKQPAGFNAIRKADLCQKQDLGKKRSAAGQEGEVSHPERANCKRPLSHADPSLACVCCSEFASGA